MRSISVHTFTSAASARGIGFARAGGRERPGTQAVDRALWLLLHMAGETGAGLSLKDVSASAGLDPATTHRLLGSLKRFGLVEQNPQTRRYGLGLEFFALAAAASGRLQLAERIRPTLAALSRASGLRSVCFVRNGPDLVCVETHPGRSPSAFGARDRGASLPIGAGAAGIAFLAALPDAEIESLALHTIGRLALDPEHAARDIGAAVRQAREDGHALAEDVAIGFLTLAMAIQGQSGKPEAVVAVNGPAERLSGSLAARMVQTLATHARRAEGILSLTRDRLVE